MNYADEIELLQKLQPGDRVIYANHNYGETWNIAIVKRTTETQIVLDFRGDPKFRKKDGRAVGGNTWHSSYVHPYACEYIQEYEQHQIEQDERKRRNVAHNIISSTHFSDMPLDRLERIVAIIQEQVEEGEPGEKRERE